MKNPAVKNGCFADGGNCQTLLQEKRSGTPSKKVLLISYYFPPCVYGYAARIYNFMRFLPCWGWKPYVLTIDPVYYKEKSGAHPALKDNADIVRTGSLEPKRSLFQTLYQNQSSSRQKQKNSRENLSIQSKYTRNHILIPDNQILWLPYALARGQQLMRREKIDLIYVTSPPFSPLLIGYLLKKATRKPLLFEYRDTWQDNLDHRHNLNPMRRKIEESLEGMVTRAADRIILVTQGMKRSMKKQFPREPEDKFQVIPNGFDPALCHYLHQHKVKRDTFFTITYSGSLEYDRDPRQFLLSMKELFDDQPELAKKIKIDLIGNTEQAFIDFVRKQNLSSQVNFLGYLPYEENIKHLAASDVLFLIANDARPDSIPGKLYEYLLLNKPILALVGNNVSGEFLVHFPRSRVIKPTDREGMKSFVRETFQRFAQTGHRNWKLDKDTTTYCRNNQAGQLAKLLNSVKPSINCIPEEDYSFSG